MAIQNWIHILIDSQGKGRPDFHINEVRLGCFYTDGQFCVGYFRVFERCGLRSMARPRLDERQWRSVTLTWRCDLFKIGTLWVAAGGDWTVCPHQMALMSSAGWAAVRQAHCCWQELHLASLCWRVELVHVTGFSSPQRFLVIIGVTASFRFRPPW
jgi:hypothetical protein